MEWGLKIVGNEEKVMRLSLRERVEGEEGVGEGGVGKKSNKYGG
jgi:hypothetical protein